MARAVFAENAALVEQPLRRRADKANECGGGNLPVQPYMHADNRRTFERIDLRKKSVAGHRFRQQPEQLCRWHGRDEVAGLEIGAVAQPYCRYYAVAHFQTIGYRTAGDHAVALLDKFASRVTI